MQLFLDWLLEVWSILARSGPFLLFGLAVAGWIKAAVPERWVMRHLGGDDLRSVTKASLVGAPLPLCSCSVVPTAIALEESGASKGATTSFLISTPETGVDSVGITWALIDPLMTVARPIAAVSTALAAGLAVNGLVRHDSQRAGDRQPVDEPPPVESSESAVSAECPECTEPVEHAHEDAKGAAGGSVVRRGLAYAFGPLLADLAPWLVLGFAASALIALAVPDDFFGETLPGNWASMLIMLVVGVPLYVCATASTPVAAALMAKGLNPGAALVFLLAGPATNLATIGVVGGRLGGRVLTVYLTSIAVLALAGGWLLDLLYPLLGFDPLDVASAAEHESLGLLSEISGGILGLLLLRQVLGMPRVRRALRRLRGGAGDPTP